MKTKAILPILLIPLSLVAIWLVIILMPDESCMQWDGWHYEKIWPLPEHCQTPGEES